MSTQTRGPAGADRTIGQLVADATHDVQGIIHSEIALAKAEIQAGAKKAGVGAGMLGAAALFGLLGLIFLLHSIARLIGEWLPIWAGYLIVAGVLLLVAGILAAMGIKGVKQAKPPTKAIAEAQQTIATLRG